MDSQETVRWIYVILAYAGAIVPVAILVFPDAFGRELKELWQDFQQTPIPVLIMIPLFACAAVMVVIAVNR